MADDPDWDYPVDDDRRRECSCDNPDPVNDEPWVPVECGNCGGVM